MSYYTTLALILLGYMTLWFLASLVKKRNDVADVSWGLGFVLLAWTSYFLGESESLRSLVIVALITIWGVRLASHIARRHRGRPEDFRYAKWRSEWGKWFVLRSYGQIYLLQGFLLFLVAMPVLVGNSMTGASWGILETVGLLI